MKLEKFTADKYQEICGKQFCLYEKSMQYIQEFIVKYDVLKDIICIFEDNARQQDAVWVNGVSVKVQPSDCLGSIDWENAELIITSDYYKEAYDKLRAHPMISEKLECIYYFANRETEYEEYYRKLYEDSSLEDIIIFRSGPHASSYVKGMDFADNARALFEYMLENGYNRKYKLVWLVNKPEEFSKWSRNTNVSFLSYHWSVSEKQEERKQYYQALCLAKYIFFTDAYGFARNCRKDQIRVQLWHGCGFKTRVNFVRCEKRYEYTTVVSELYSQIHQDIYGLRSDQMLVTGYAKEDWLFHPTQKEYKKLLDIPEADKYIFWLPTFRTAKKNMTQLNEYELGTETGFPIIGTEERFVRLNELLYELNVALLIKLHPFQDRSVISDVKLSNIILIDNEQLFEEDIQINELLADADALISDYSSAAVDYMLLDRPIAFTLDDVKEYEESRGFVFENIKDWLPGKEVYSFEDFCVFVREVAECVDTTKEKRGRLRKQMHKYHDDQNCKRIIEAVGITM